MSEKREPTNHTPGLAQRVAQGGQPRPGRALANILLLVPYCLGWVLAAVLCVVTYTWRAFLAGYTDLTQRLNKGVEAPDGSEDDR